MYAHVYLGLNTIKVLPNVRQLSVALVTRKCSLNKEKTMSMAIWAAFIGHDMTHTAISTTRKINITEVISGCVYVWGGGRVDYKLKYRFSNL